MRHQNGLSQPYRTRRLFPFPFRLRSVRAFFPIMGIQSCS